MSYDPIHKANEILHTIPGGQAIKIVWEGNPSADAPYHNNHHNAVVAVETYALADALNMRNSTRKHELFIAGLFHDYGHKAGTNPDHENITEAIQQIYNMEDLLETHGYNPDSIAHYIAGTEYPLPDYFTLNTGHRILRDADLFHWIHPNYVTLQGAYLDGLTLEKGEPVTLASTEDFLSKVDWYSDEAKEYYLKSAFDS